MEDCLVFFWGQWSSVVGHLGSATFGRLRFPILAVGTGIGTVILVSADDAETFAETPIMFLLRLLYVLPFLARARASLTFKGVDWSSVAVEEKAGISYKAAGGAASKLENILVSSGVNTVRQRIWVSDKSTYNLAYNVALAKRANAAGLKVYLDLHFSDTWADPGHQGDNDIRYDPSLSTRS